MKTVFLSILFWVIPQLSLCQVIIDKSLKPLVLDHKMQIYRDSTDKLAIEDFIKNLKQFPFKNIESTSPNIGRDNHNHWISFEVKNISTESQTLYLSLDHPFIDFLNVYIVENNTIIKKATFEYEAKVKTGLLKHLARPTIEIEAKSQIASRVFIKIRNTAGVLTFGMALVEKEDFLKKANFEQNLQTLFFGIIMAFALLAITYFFISKSRIYLYYGLYIIFFDVSFQGIIGNLYNMSSFKLDFFNGDSSFRFYAVLGLIFNVLFLRKLFETPSGRNFYNYFTYFILTICTFLLIVTVFDWGFIYYRISSVINVYTIFLAIALFTIFYNYKRNYKTLKLYLVSFLPLILVLLVRILSEENIIETPINISQFVLPSFTFEFLILLVGLSKIFIDKINEKNALEAKIITSQIETQESERRKIAHDLHDDLGSTLSVLKEQIFRGTDNPETQNLINKAIDDLRNISHNLLPADFEAFGFIPSLEKYISKLNGVGLKITLIVFGERQVLQNSVELNLYRILVEILHNIKKHSKSREATVQLIYHDKFLYVSIENNDKVENNQEKGNGIGEKSITSRLEYLHARVLEKGARANGYSYIFEVPYDQNPNS